MNFKCNVMHKTWWIPNDSVRFSLIKFQIAFRFRIKCIRHNSSALWNAFYFSQMPIQPFPSHAQSHITCTITPTFKFDILPYSKFKPKTFSSKQTIFRCDFSFYFPVAVSINKQEMKLNSCLCVCGKIASSRKSTEQKKT